MLGLREVGLSIPDAPVGADVAASCLTPTLMTEMQCANSLGHFISENMFFPKESLTACTPFYSESHSTLQVYGAF